MKKIGIIGGIGWPSTIEYYRLICEASQQYHQDKVFTGPIPMPEISIESLNLNFTVNNRGSSEPGSWLKWDECFKKAASRLQASGAELIVLASVTPHARLKEISDGISVPFVSIYESIGAHCQDHNIDNVLVLGTMPTMTTLAFKNGVKAFGVNAIYPSTDVLKEQVIEVIEALYQYKTQGTALAIDRIVRACVSDEDLKNTVVCLGCTDLTLAFESSLDKASFDYKGVGYLNASVLHAATVFQACAQ